MRTVSIVGARPQFIKAAVIDRVLRSSQVEDVLVHTGQHYDPNMSDIFFEEMEIPKPDTCLGIGSGTHGMQTGTMLCRIEETLRQEMPNLVVVYGDTNSTLAGALAAVKLHIPVAHVEAGLRSYNRRMPEEINRVLTDHASDLLFAPTQAAVENLQREGFSAERISLVGDVMYDASLFYGYKAEQKSRILQKLGLGPKEYLLATIHRAENTDDSQRLRNIFEGFELAAREIPVIIPLHPRTRKALVEEMRMCRSPACLRIIEPVGYLDMVMLEKNARMIATDSGGVQKEAFFYAVPCVTLRDETEWVELVDLGWNQLVPPVSPTAVLNGVMSSLNRRGSPGFPYGNGNAAHKIVDGIKANWPQFFDKFE